NHVSTSQRLLPAFKARAWCFKKGRAPSHWKARESLHTWSAKQLFLRHWLDVSDVDRAGGLVEASVHFYLFALELFGLVLIIELIRHAANLEHILVARFHYGSGKRIRLLAWGLRGRPLCWRGRPLLSKSGREQRCHQDQHSQNTDHSLHLTSSNRCLY